MAEASSRERSSNERPARSTHEVLESAEVGVLIVDDSVVVQQRLKRALEDLEGVRVLGQAYCAPEGVDLIDRQGPDLVTLDIRMPGGDGFELLETVERRGVGPEIVVLTNHASPQVRRRCFELGAAAFFDKSTDIEDLMRHIEGMRNGKRGKNSTCGAA